MIKTVQRGVHFQISRTLYDPSLKGETADLTMVIQKSKKVSRKKYIIVRHTVYDLQEDDRRPGVQESEIVLAFSIAENIDSVIKDQKVYAFLPINNYGISVSISKTRSPTSS